MIDPPNIAHRRLQSPLVLATDLDGTFAGGSELDRAELQQLLTTRSDTTLIYVTGRSIPAARQLMVDTALPHPDLLIADVGTTVRHGPELAPLLELEMEIADIWPGGAVIRSRLAGLPGLVEQEVRSPYRVSYTPAASAHLAAASLSPLELDSLEPGAGAIMENATLIEEARVRLEGLTVDLIGSAGIYLDVLPAGVNKGTTLRRVLQWLGRPEEEVIVAGDSMNDLALFDLGITGVAVGNSEPELLERVADREWVYTAASDGAAGILEALEHFGWQEVDDGK